MIQRFITHCTAETAFSIILSLLVLACYQSVSRYGFVNDDDFTAGSRLGGLFLG